jgi:uncharacterized protein YbjT (DUF2867 family)
MLYAMGGSQPGVIENFIGDTRIGWVDAADIAAVAATALRDPAAHAGQAYRLATELASMGEVAAMLIRRPWPAISRRSRRASVLDCRNDEKELR